MNILKKFTPFLILIILTLGVVLPISNCSAGLLATTSDIDAQNNALLGSAGFDQNIQFANIIAIIIGAVLGLLGIIFLVLLIMGGYQWMTAGGNEDSVEKAQERIKSAIIGLIIVLAAYAITAFVFTNLPIGSSSPGTTGTL
ncbi:MAG: hypothetical protein WC564_01010 [Patescibacteria group bacterium]